MKEYKIIGKREGINGSGKGIRKSMRGKSYRDILYICMSYYNEVILYN